MDHQWRCYAHDARDSAPGLAAGRMVAAGAEKTLVEVVAQRVSQLDVEIAAG